MLSYEISIVLLLLLFNHVTPKLTKEDHHSLVGNENKVSVKIFSHINLTMVESK